MPMLRLQGLSLSYPDTHCFTDFSTTLEWGQHIGLIGDNGTGKSSLLAMLAGLMPVQSGHIIPEGELSIGHVPQHHSSTRSGGEQVMDALHRALAGQPELLLLDEPDNHLDSRHRQQLQRRLAAFAGTLLLVTHDDTLLEAVCDTLWIVRDGTIQVFHGSYGDYLAEQAMQRHALEARADALKQQQLAAHQALMKEQQRAAHARERGAKSIKEHKWATIKSPAKLERGTTTTGRKRAGLAEQRRELTQALEACRQPVLLTPRFHLPATAGSRGPVVQLRHAAVGHAHPVLDNIHLTLNEGERMQITGANGSGKSTLVRALYGETCLRLGGDWLTPAPRDIGYIDQQHANLDPTHTVLEALRARVPDWNPGRCRQHLADFLFRGERVVTNRVGELSGGERTRLALACLAARVPKLLILDEVTNHLDRTLRQHLTEILAPYPGTLILISHDTAFVKQLGITTAWSCDAPS